MSQHEPGTEQEKEYGDSAAAVSPDTQYADPSEALGEGRAEPADTEDTTYAAGTADAERARPSEDPEASEDERRESEVSAQGTDAETVSDGPDAESGFYG